MRHRRAFAILLILSFILLIGKTNAQSTPKSDKRNTAAQSPKTQSSKQLLDLNSATKDQLSALPGIGDVYAQKVIDSRPYKTKTDLVRKKVIPQSVYNRISARVVARQPSATQPQISSGSPATRPATSAATQETQKPADTQSSSNPAATTPQPSSKASAAQKVNPPARPVLLTGAPMGGVKFEHAKHKVECSTCHHASRQPKPGSAPQEACTSCHTKPPQPGMKTAKQAAFHNPTATAGTCIDCHKKSGGDAPTKCMQCHKTENA